MYLKNCWIWSWEVHHRLNSFYLSVLSRVIYKQNTIIDTSYSLSSWAKWSSYWSKACFIVMLLLLNHWFPTSGPWTTSGPQKPKYGPRMILILWLGMVRRNFCMIITVIFFYTHMHSGPYYQVWYKTGPWSGKSCEPLS